MADSNVSFYWNITMDKNVLIQTLQHNQTVNNIGIDDCSVNGVVILNITLKDEKTQSLINETIYNTTVQVDVDIYPVNSSTSIISYSNNFTKKYNPRVCLKGLNSTYDMDVQILYDADGYAAEFYHIQKATLKNSSIPTNINLYDLDDTSAQQFLITYKDDNFVPIEDALIEIQRKYVSEGVFKSVEIPKTDDSGQATASFELSGAVYTIIVTKNGVIQATFDNVAIYCEDKVIGDCKINLNALGSGTDFDDWNETGGITYTITFDKNTRTITTIFTTTDGTSKTVLLNATKFDRFGNHTVCYDSLTTSSGTLTCLIPASYGNVTVVAVLTSDGTTVTTRTYTILPNAADRFGVSNGGIMLLLLLLTLPLMLVTSTIGVMIGIFAGIIFGGMFMLFNTESILGATSIVIWLLAAGGIIIWKISRRT